MNRSAKLSLVIFLLLQLYHAAGAAPDYPFEGLLPRAQTIFIGHITKSSQQQGVTFEISEMLRGNMQQKTITFGFAGLNDKRSSGVGSSYLVISQGDNHFGKPGAIVSFGQTLKGQAGYCGWLSFPIKAVDDSQYVDLIYTRPGPKPDNTPVRLMLERARTLIRQVPFRPDLHGNGAE